MGFRRRILLESLESMDLLAVDLVAEFIALPTEIRAGEIAEFTLRVSNQGEEDAFDVLVESDVAPFLKEVHWSNHAGPHAKTGVGEIEEVVDLRAGDVIDYMIRGVVVTANAIEIGGSAVECLSQRQCADPSPQTSVESLDDRTFAILITNEHRSPMMVDASVSLESLSNPSWQRQQAFPSFEISDLNGERGYTIQYVEARLGPWNIPKNHLSSNGDLTGDGIDDFVFGGGDDTQGDVYLERGDRTNRPATVPQSNGGNALWLTSDNISGANNAIGDFNGDGVGDVYAQASGPSIIRFGGTDRSIQLPSYWSSGISFGGGDLNGDGFDDVLLSDAWRSVVLFGHETEGVIDFETLDASFFLDLNRANVSSADMSGDLNGDGFDDLALKFEGEPFHDMIFGSSDLNEIDGFEHDGIGQTLGLRVVSDFTLPVSEFLEYDSKTVAIVGDVNADGFDDAVHTTASGATLLFGHTNLASEGFLPGVVLDADVSLAVDAMGDFNGDGIDDMLLAPSKNEPGVFVVFGNRLIDQQERINVRELNGLVGTSVRGLSLGWPPEQTFSNAGDINADGFEDIVANGWPSGSNHSELYVIYGQDRFASGDGNIQDERVRLEPNSAIRYFVHSETAGNAIDIQVDVSLSRLQLDANEANNVTAAVVNVLPNRADLNTDGRVSMADFEILSNNFGRTNVAPNEGDINEDGKVDFADFLRLSDQFEA